MEEGGGEEQKEKDILLQQFTVISNNYAKQHAYATQVIDIPYFLRSTCLIGSCRWIC